MGMYNEIVGMWRSWAVKTDSDIDMRLDNYRILFAYNSCRIENENITYHDTREIFENGRAVNFTGDPRTLFELRNQKLCYEYLKQRIINREPLSLELVLEVHNILTSGTYDERRFIERGNVPVRLRNMIM
jgi:Fic family protein